MQKKAIVAGHICLDITPVIPGSEKNSLSELLSPGKLVETKEAKVSLGGAVANTGLAMQYFGVDVKLMGKTGEDAFGDLIFKKLKEHGAETGLIRSKEENTSYTVVLAVPGIDRIFLHCPGANNAYYAKDIPEEALKEASLFHFGYPPLMRSVYRNDGEELLQILKKARTAGCATSLDLAALDPDSESGRADWKKILERTLPFTDFFVPSVEEVCYMLDRDRFLEWKERGKEEDVTDLLDPDKDIRPVGDLCMKLGCRVLLLKCGAKGLYYRTASKEALEEISPRLSLDCQAWAGREGFERAFRPDRILSATGAGDVSIAAFLTSVLSQNTPEESVSLAAAAGACCVSSYDALSALVPLSEMKKRIEQGWEKNPAV